jgi:hypothetical protein
MSILMYFCHNSCLGATLLTPLPIGFTAISDHQRAGGVPPGCGPQSGAAPVNFPVSFWSWVPQSVGGGQFLVRPTLFVFLNDSWRCTVLGKFPKP